MQSFSAQFVESECLLLLITSASCKADFLHQLAYYCYSKAKWSNSLKKMLSLINTIDAYEAWYYFFSPPFGQIVIGPTLGNITRVFTKLKQFV